MFSLSLILLRIKVSYFVEFSLIKSGNNNTLKGKIVTGIV